MKKKILSNWGLKILALLFAMILWLAVTNATDPSITRTISGISIEVTGEKVLTDQNKVYTIESAETASIKVKGKRSVVDQLSENDFTATAPLEEMSIVDAVPVYIHANSARNRAELEVVDKTNSITVDIEDIITKSYDLQVLYEGEPSDGYCRDTSDVAVSSVTVQAPKSVQNLINKVAVKVNINGATTDISGKYKVGLYKADGTEIEKNENIKLSANSVRTTTPILQVKKVDIIVSSSGVPAEGYEKTGVSANIATVNIAGKAEELDKVSKIEIPSSVMDITGASNNVIRTVDLSQYIPSGCRLYNADVNEMKITAYIEAQITKTLTVSKNSIEILNVPDGYKVEFEDENSIKIIVEGLNDALNRVETSNISTSLNLKKCKEGKNSVKLTVLLPDGVILADEVKVNVNLVDTKSKDETTTSVEEETTT